jgi:ABC-2 type transport system permease protein
MSVPTAPPVATEDRARRPVTLWRLEVLRLWRTYRWTIVFGAYLLFALLGPLTARYMNELMQQVGGDVTIIAPDPRPVDGLIQFVSNASQLGMLAVVVVAAGALAFDAHPERAAFLRTRMDRPGRLVLAPYVVTTLTMVATLAVTTAVAVALTSVLIGGVPAGPVVVGTLFGSLYLAFAVAVVAFMASTVRSQVGTVFASLGALLALPMLAMIEVLRPWLPSELLTAVLAMVEGAPAGDFLRSTAVAVVATLALLWSAAVRLERREL